MKILVLQNGWAGAGISGGDKHILDLCEILKKKHEVNLMLPRQGLFYIKDNWSKESEAIKIWELSDFSGGQKVTSMVGLVFLYLQRTLKACRKIMGIPPVDVVVSSSHFIYDVLPAVVYGVVRRVKKVVYVYHLLGSQKRNWGLRNLVSVGFESVSLFFIKRNYDLVVTDNKVTLDELNKLGIAKDRLILSQIGIKRPPPELLKREKVFDLVYLGRVSKLKGIYDLLRVVEILKKENPRISLVIYGQGEEWDAAQTACRSLGLEENVKLPGFTPGEAKMESLAGGRVFVLPSSEEGWGISLAEAMSLALPAVVYDLPEIRGVFGPGPIYCPVGDCEKFAVEVRRLLGDPNYYGEKSRHALDCVKNYYLDGLELPEFEALGVEI